MVRKVVLVEGINFEFPNFKEEEIGILKKIFNLKLNTKLILHLINIHSLANNFSGNFSENLENLKKLYNIDVNYKLIEHLIDLEMFFFKSRKKREIDIYIA